MAAHSTTGRRGIKARVRNRSQAKGGKTTKVNCCTAPVASRRKRLSVPELTHKLESRDEELNESLEQQAATAEILKVINASPGDLTPVFDIILEKAHSLCDVPCGSLQLFDNAHTLAVAVRGMAELFEKFLRQGYRLDRNQPVQSLRPFQIDDLAKFATDGSALQAAFELGGLRTMLSVPLVRNGVAFGRIVAGRQEVRPFSEHQIELLRSFADQAVIAIENARLFNETKEALEQQTATADILKVIASSPSDVQPVFEVIVERAVRLCGARMGRVYRYDGNVIQMVAGYGLSVPGLGKVQQVFPRPATDDTIAGQVIQSRKAYFVTDIEHDQSVPALSRQMIEALGTRSQVTVPMLRAGGEPIGAITVGWADPGAYQDQQVTLLKTFATQAVIAIENARLFNETKEALERQTATAEILQAINSSPGDLAPVFDAILEKAHRLCDVAQGSLQLYDGSKFRAVAIRGLSEAFANRLREGVSVNPNAQPLLKGARFVQIPDLGEIDDPLSRAAFELAGIHTVLFIPLRKDGTLLGRISASRSEVKLFTEKEIGLLESFAAQAVIAMENARLLGELRRRTSDLTESLQQQTATADVLKVISRSAFDLQPVFDAIAENAVRLCEAERAFIFRFDGHFLRAVASYNVGSEVKRFVEENPIALGRSSIAARAGLERRTMHVDDVQADADYAYAVRDVDPIRTILAVPMLNGDELVGVITIYRVEVKPFTDKQVTLVETFAAQAVIAVENTRLLNELRQSLQQQTATAEVLKVISRSTFDLPAVLHALVETAARLCNADKGTITRQKDGAFYRAESYGFSKDFMNYVRSIPVVMDRHTATGRALLEGVVVHIPDVEADPEYSFSEAQRLGDYRSLLGVPMMREGVAIGVIALTRTEARAFTEKEIELAMTFADQAAIAIENVRLFDEVQARTGDLAASLQELRTAQDRLIQTEKLASLGQLTAGIAHEIKNPLNFVNNFSALSVELTDELNDLLRQAALADKFRAQVDELTGLLKENLGKVVQHGKRADSIVRNMLLHSREGTGERRSADINTLVGESLNLAYHGARAEKPGFTITLKHDLDPNAGALDLYPQEITRALLNLISNGFYAAIRRKAEADDDTFEAVLSASTRDLGETVEIRIRDNGTGISPEVRAKMFNPFFTTKPT